MILIIQKYEARMSALGRKQSFSLKPYFLL